MNGTCSVTLFANMCGSSTGLSIAAAATCPCEGRFVVSRSACRFVPSVTRGPAYDSEIVFVNSIRPARCCTEFGEQFLFASTPAGTTANPTVGQVVVAILSFPSHVWWNRCRSSSTRRSFRDDPSDPIAARSSPIGLTQVALVRDPRLFRTRCLILFSNFLHRFVRLTPTATLDPGRGGEGSGLVVLVIGERSLDGAWSAGIALKPSSDPSAVGFNLRPVRNQFDLLLRGAASDRLSVRASRWSRPNGA